MITDIIHEPLDADPAGNNTGIFETVNENWRVLYLKEGPQRNEQQIPIYAESQPRHLEGHTQLQIHFFIILP